MAEMNEIFTRIQLKYDSYNAWTTAPGKNVVLLAGELGIAKLVNDVTIPLDSEKNAPVLFKVGDGVHTFEQLPWASALAADVHTWAKKPEAEFLAWIKGLVPVEVIDNGTGKFVTDVTATNDANGHHITITRSDVDWADIQNKPNLVNSVKVTDDDVVIGTPVDATSGNVTIDIKHKAYNKAGATTDVAGDATTAGSSVTIKVPTLTVDAYGHTEFTGETSHTITIPSEVVVGDGNITIAAGDGLAEGGSFNVNQDDNATITLKHADTSSVANVTAADRTYVKSLTFDDFGHVTAVDVGTETVVDTDTQYHVEYDSDNKKIKLIAGADANKMEIDATDFIKDGMIQSVSLETEDGEGNKGQFLKIVWNTDADVDADDITYVNVTTLVDVYVGEKTDNIEVTVTSDNKIKADLTDAAKAKLNKEWQPVGNYKTTQAVVNDKGLTGAKVLKNLSQNANGEIVYETRDLTTADIGAQPAGNYKITQEAKNYADGSTVKTVTEITQDTNGVITGVKFEDIDFSEVGHAASADVAYKLDTTKGDTDGIVPGIVIDGTSIAFKAVAGGVPYRWTNDNVAIGVGSLGGKGKLTVDEYVDGREAFTTIEGATVTTENVVTDKATIGGVEIKSNETTTGAVKYLVFNCGSATALVD